MDERRLVTVVFADVVGSTTLSDDMDPEDTRALMGRYFGHATTVIESVGGRLEKFIGDAVVALFGIPRATGDEAERAVGAALALRAAVAADEVLGSLITLRIGVNLGEVMTNIESAGDQFIASGDVMNTAARLQQSAEPGEIIVSERVHLAVEDGFEFGPSRLVALRGKEGSFRVFPLTRPRAHRRAERPPMSGRQRDLLQLRLTAGRVIDEQRVHLVTVLGQSGIGKTRLVAEFIASLPSDLAFDLVTIDITEYLQTGADPLRAMVRALLGTEVTAERIRTLFTERQYSDAEGLERAQTMLAALGSGGSVGVESAPVVAALRMLLDLCTRDRAIVLVVDDAHRASDLLLDLVEQAAVPRGSAQLLWIVVARPEILDRRPSWGGGHGNHVSLPLQPLTDAQIDKLVAHYLTDRPDGVVESIRQRAGGNPFFALEFVRAVIQNDLRLDAVDAPAVRLPDTVHAAVLARLDRLGPAALDLLRLLSVGGSALPYHRLLSRLPAWDGAALDRGAEELLTHDIVHRVDGDRLGIRHSFFGDIAYGSLSRTTAIHLHTEMARALADASGDALASEQLIGHHYLSAIRLSRRLAVPAPLPFEPSEAVPRLVAAGEAASRAAHALEAQEFVTGAITLAPAGEHPLLLELLATMSGISPQAADALARAIEALPTTPTDPDERETAVRLRRKLLMLWVRCGLMDRLAITLEQLLEVYNEAHRLARIGVSRDEAMRLGAVDLFVFVGGVQVVDEHFVERTDARELIAAGRSTADHFLEQGDPVAVSEVLDGCQAAALAVDLPALALDFGMERMALRGLPLREFGDALVMLARSQVALGKPVDGIRAIETRLAEGQSHGYAGGLAHPIAYGLSIAYSCGEWDTAERIGATLVRIYHEAAIVPADRPFCADGFLALTRIALAREDATLAAHYASMFLGSLQDMPMLLAVGQKLLTLELQDGAATIDDISALGAQAVGFVAFNNERGLVSTSEEIAAAATNPSAKDSGVVAVATALRNADHAALAACIADLDADVRWVTAARLRVVLAERTGDGAALAQARAALETLRDHRFLRRLTGVESRLGVQRVAGASTGGPA